MTNSPFNQIQPFDKDTATSFVVDLFALVLNRIVVSDVEVQHWADFLVVSQDAPDLLRRFAASDEYKNRLKSYQSSEFAPGHFYSPIVDLDEIFDRRGKVFSDRVLNGIDLNLQGQTDLFRRMLPHFSTLPFTDGPVSSFRYYYNNTSYAYGDAATYWAMLAVFRPLRLIEIGSGFTSALALDAIQYMGLDTCCTFIDPFPALLTTVASPVGDRHTIISSKVQDVEPSIVEALQSGDILFIDSSHIVKTGSDVHFELTELLPRLRKGVIVHFHDVFYPFEYPEQWILQERKSWNEVYFLHSFLMFNLDFEIIYFNDCFAKLQNELVSSSLPANASSRLLLNPGGGLWLRKI